MVIAAIAFHDLSATEQNRVSALLRHHPDFEKWKGAYVPEKAGPELDTFIFMRASTWPDAIRHKGNPYDHPGWHYIDYPLEAPNFPEKPGPTPDNDILFGLSYSETILTNQNSTIQEKAAFLSWLIHLVGDIHQPLHCATLVNASYPAPVGDKGGNLFYVRPAEAAVALHSIWDRALGSSVNPRTEINYAAVIRAKYPRSSLQELTMHKIPAGWSIESRDLAIKFGYLNGYLKGSMERDDAPHLPADYTKNMKMIAERQAALAGYRLADAIKAVIR